jgi:golgi to ER traffic protein 4
LGEYPAGDPELHHVAGSLYADEHEPYEAEKHLILGTKDSPDVLARLEYDWYKEDDAHTAALYASRAVLPYLLVANLRAANTAYRTFTTALAADNKSLAPQDVSTTAGADVRVFPSLPLLNYLGLLLLAVQRGSPDVWRQLNAKYGSHIQDEAAAAWAEPLETIAEMYFGVQRPRQSNPLFDMMGSLFGGAQPGGPAAGGRKKPAAKRVEAPAAEGLD